MHNDLGFFTVNKKRLKKQMNISYSFEYLEQIQYKTLSGVDLHNLSDLYLKQGLTVISEHYSELAYQYSDTPEFINV